LSKEFRVGQKVTIKRKNEGKNRRVPEYAKGGSGTIMVSYGIVTGNKHDHTEEWGPLYSVLLDPAVGSSGEKLFLDVHASWLEDADSNMPEAMV
jgi:hypothetical protein